MLRSHRPFLVLVPLTLLLVLTTAPRVGADPAPGKRYAVLVGVQKYDHAKLDPLDFAENDVRELADLLRPAGYEVALLTEATGKDDPALLPTKTNIDKQLKAMLTKCQKEDLVLVALAGHGLQFEGKPEAYFCPKDARPLADRTETLLSLDGVYQRMAASEAGVKLLLVDACRNDPGRGRGRGVDANSLEKAPPKGVFAFYSCSTGERAFEHPELKHGVFFHYVLEGLKGEAADRDGEVTFESLALYVRKEVPRRVPQLVHKDAKQTPALRMAEASGASPVLVSKLEQKLAADMLGALSEFSAQILIGKAEEEVIRKLADGRMDRWEEAAKLGSRHGQYLYGLCVWYGVNRIKSKKEGEKWFRMAAEQGLAHAQYELGWMYEKARGGVWIPNYEEGLKWYRKAADQGHAPAQNNLAWMYKEGQGVPKDKAEAVKWFRKAAETGHVQAQFELGFACDKGHGIAQDFGEAFKWYRKAAGQGHAVAQNNLGYAYAEGQGVAKDEVEAVKWYRKAAEQGLATAQDNLGISYREGEGVAKDFAEALKWFRKAAAQGKNDAYVHLGRMCENGQGVTKDFTEAIKWYRKAADNDNAKGQFNVGWMYDKGKGVAQDYTEAAQWYRKAAEQGHASAQNNLGYAYANGQGLAKDEAEAVKWYRKAAEQGDDVAQKNLGVMYQDGRGVAENLGEAIKWYRKAAAQGHDGAQKALRRLNVNP